MIDEDYYTQQNHGPYQIADIGDFALEDGGTIRGCKLAYATFGQLSQSHDNAILVTTWFAATSKIMEQVYVGSGRALDPSKYFILIVNQLGSGLSSSPNNLAEPFGKANFPRVRISDDVRAQHKLLTEQFGIERLELVTGGSMGTQQAYEWAVRYPEMVKRVATLAGTARTTPHCYLYVQTLIDAIVSDPAFENGWYENPRAVREGLRRHTTIWAVMGLSSEMWKQELWRSLGFSSLSDFKLGFLDATFTGMDPNALLSMAWKWQQADVSRNTGGDLRAALGHIQAKTFVMPISTDMFFPVADCESEQKLIPRSELRVMKSTWGHISLYGPDERYLEQVKIAFAELLALPE